MIITSDISRLNLRSGELLRLRKAAGSTIVCDSGSVWITRDNDPRDVILGPGERVDVCGAGTVLIQAFEHSSVAIGPRRHAALADGAQRSGAAAARFLGTACNDARVAQPATAAGPTVIDIAGARPGGRGPSWLHAA